MTEFEQLVRRYGSAYIKERCEQRSAEYERHPAELRVFVHFFEHYELPEEIYRRLWAELGLKSAIMGRSKILYGRLREIVAERVPSIDGEKPENFLELNRALDAYLARIKEDPEREEEESAAFFARKGSCAAAGLWKRNCGPTPSGGGTRLARAWCAVSLPFTGSTRRSPGQTT